MADAEYVVVLVTTPDDGELAEKLAKGLVESKLAACVTRQSGNVSHYMWEGKLETDAETLLIIKTRASLFPEVARYISENHGAKVPEVIALPIIEGADNYLQWLGANTSLGPPDKKQK